MDRGQTRLKSSLKVLLPFGFSLVLVATAGATELVVTATKGLNLRAGPGVKCEVVGSVAYDEVVTEMDYKAGTGNYKGWYKVKTKAGEIGWVCAGLNNEFWLIRTDEKKRRRF